MAEQQTTEPKLKPHEIEALRAVREKILQEHARFQMELISGPPVGSDSTEGWHGDECAHCIAGWGVEIAPSVFDGVVPWHQIMGGMLYRLVTPYNWPKALHERYDAARYQGEPDTKAMAEVAVEAIDLFIKRDGVWACGN